MSSKASDKVKRQGLQPGVFTLVLVFIVSAILLIVINYFTIKTLSAMRAYTNGESLYSKGQKDATHYLLLYINTGDELYWAAYDREISVPLGDSVARVTLLANGSESLVRQGFLAAGNHPDDLDEMIWLFRNFREVSFMKDAILIWTKGDYLCAQENELAHQAREAILKGTLTAQERIRIAKKANEITSRLTLLEKSFGDVLGVASREINKYLFAANVIMILLIIGSATGYAMVMLRRMREKNHELQEANQYLDSFVYSVSHDLKAPINSLKGLITVAKMENSQGKTGEYLDMMEQSIDKQNQFIKEIIEFSRNKKTRLGLEEVNLDSIVEEAFLQHQYMEGAAEITIEKELKVQKVASDPLRLKIILNNLVSNGIRYCDRNKKKKFIKVSAEKIQNEVLISVADNGIGIKAEHIDRIFDMYFVSYNDNRSTGLGLHLAQNAAEKLGGKISVESQPGEGSRFTVRIPVMNGHAASSGLNS